MSVLSMILCSVVGFLVYVQIGRFLGWWSYRTFHAHLQYKVTAWTSYVDVEQGRGPDVYFTALREGPKLSMRILFPVMSFGWRNGCKEVVTDGPMNVLHSPHEGTEDLYRYLMMCLWPVKVIWCLGAWLVIGAIVATRLAIRFFKWSYRLLFAWPERKVTEPKRQGTKKTVSQEHTVN